MYHQIHLLDLYPTMARLKFLIEEECNHPNAATLDIAMMLQRYLNFLLKSEIVAQCRIKDVLAPLIRTNRYGQPTPEALAVASCIEEEIHDELLMMTRTFLTLDESERVIEIFVRANGDTEIIVEEREILRLQADVQSEREFGQLDAEDHAFRKMYY
jgi:hypothetical protein